MATTDTPNVSKPDAPGGFVGDLWFGHPIIRAEATHRWDGTAWHLLPIQPNA